MSMEKDPNRWKTIAACILVPALIVTALVAWGGAYAHKNPDSVFAYCLYKTGVRAFEPSYRERRQGIALVGEFKSYISVKEATNALKSKGLAGEWRGSRAGQNREEGIWLLTVNSYSDLGITGKLSLQFFNDRLMGAKFYPDEPEKYFSMLEKQLNISFQGTNQIWLPPATHIMRGRSSKDDRNLSAIWWMDTSLKKELFAWELRYSQPNPADD